MAKSKSIGVLYDLSLIKVTPKTLAWLKTRSRATDLSQQEIAGAVLERAASGTLEPERSKELDDVKGRYLQAQNVVEVVLQALYDSNTDGENARLAYVLKSAVEIMDASYDRLDAWMLPTIGGAAHAEPLRHAS